MRDPLTSDDASLTAARALDVELASFEPEGATPASPGEVVTWLARLRLLHGVPFAYLVAHDEMVPNESIRFFHIDRNWLDAAVDGALSVAAVTARDRELLAALLADLRAEVDEAERRIRGVEDNATRRVDDGAISTGGAVALTGFVLRSSAVSGWPGMEVRASVRDGDELRRLRFLRLERLAPGVLLAVIDGVPDRIELTEPRSGIQFGVDAKDDGGAVLPLRHPSNGRSLPLRDPGTGEPEPNGDPTFDAQVVPGELRDGDDLRVPFREGGHGTVHIAELARRLRGVSFDDRPLVAPHDQPDEPGAPPTGPASDDLAVQLLQFPYRQPFEGGGERGGDGPFSGFARGDLTIHLDRVFITR